jgi:hypothetical protein
LLDRDPLPSDFPLPDSDLLPEQVNGLPRIGLTQASEDEYRGVLEDTGIEPSQIWRGKYFVEHSWDKPGSSAAFLEYHTGLHRRATGNTLWLARFDSEAQATAAVSKIGAAAHLKPYENSYTLVGPQPPFTNNGNSPGHLALWHQGPWVLMSTLPLDATKTLLRSKPSATQPQTPQTPQTSPSDSGSH